MTREQFTEKAEDTNRKIRKMHLGLNAPQSMLWGDLYDEVVRDFVDKAAKWIGSHLLSSWQGEYLDDFRKEMEE